MELKKMENQENLKIIYKTITDDFEGDIKNFITEKIIKPQDLSEWIKNLNNNNDGEMAHEILYIVDSKTGEVLPISF
jgi:hypothetical protein